MADTITISGTDPTNPRCAADIIARLEQIERDTKAMADEAGRLMMFAGLMVGPLMDQGRPHRTAAEWSKAVTNQIRTVRKQLEGVSSACRSAVATVHDSRVILRARFEWRPTNGR